MESFVIGWATSLVMPIFGVIVMLFKSAFRSGVIISD